MFTRSLSKRYTMPQRSKRAVYSWKRLLNPAERYIFYVNPIRRTSKGEADALVADQNCGKWKSIFLLLISVASRYVKYGTLKATRPTIRQNSYVHSGVLISKKISLIIKMKKDQYYNDKCTFTELVALKTGRNAKVGRARRLIELKNTIVRIAKASLLAIKQTS